MTRGKYCEGKKYVVSLEHEWRDYPAGHEFLVSFRGESKTGLLRFAISYWNSAWGSGIISTPPEAIAAVRELPLANYADTALITRLVSRASLTPERVEPIEAGWLVYLRASGEAKRTQVTEALDTFGFEVTDTGHQIRVEVYPEDFRP